MPQNSTAVAIGRSYFSVGWNPQRRTGTCKKLQMCRAVLQYLSNFVSSAQVQVGSLNPHNPGLWTTQSHRKGITTWAGASTDLRTSEKYFSSSYAAPGGSG